MRRTSTRTTHQPLDILRHWAEKLQPLQTNRRVPSSLPDEVWLGLSMKSVPVSKNSSCTTYRTRGLGKCCSRSEAEERRHTAYHTAYHLTRAW
ncbi:unnamed protein product [Ectocarpus sp. 13 AM-2016]